MSRQLRFFDPLYGKVAFNENEEKLILSPEIQRLRYVRMCNINSLLISGASEISRFEHIIGVFHLSKIWTKSNNIAPPEANLIHAAALLHDVQTGPFGHSLEYILEDNEVEGDFRHQDVQHGAQHSFLQTVGANVAFSGAPFSSVARLGPLWERVAEIIRGKGAYGQIISGRVDLDNIDNVVRLSYHVGVATRHDADICTGLAADLKLKNGSPSISNVGAIYIERWQAIRRQLYSLLLHDWAEFSAKAMLSTMMELAVERGLIGADSWRLTDDELLSLLTKGTVGEAQLIGEIGRRLMLGDLFEPLVLWKSPGIAAYAELAKSEFKRCIEAKLSEILRTRVIFHVILDKAKTERKLTMWMRDSGTWRDFGQDTQELLIGVFLSRPERSGPAKTKAIAELILELDRVGATNRSDIDDPVETRSPSTVASQQLELL